MVTVVTGNSPLPQYRVPMQPKSWPVCGDSSLAQIKRPDGFPANGAHPVQTAVLAYRCKSGHVFARREVIYEKAPDPSAARKSAIS